MKIFTSLFAITVLFAACDPKPQEAMVTEVEKPKVKMMELPESLFKLKDLKGELRVLDFDMEEGFTAMDSLQKTKLLGSIGQFKGMDFTAHFVSLQKKVGSSQPIIVYVSAENYDALLLLTLNEENQVIAYKEIAGGLCASPQEFQDRIQWCDDKSSFIDNDSSLKVFLRHTSSPSHERLNEKNIDSVTFKYSISQIGEFAQVKKDSTRHHKVERK